MRELTADLFVSMDGFASGVNEPPFFGYFGNDLSVWIKENLEKPQVLVMGRITYAALAQFAVEATDELNVRMTALPKMVFSSTLQEPLAWKNTRLVKTSMEQEIARLKEQSGDPLRCIGSIRLVRNMMRFQLVDRLRLMIFPVVLGSAGRESIYAGYEKTSFELIGSRILDARIVLLEYKARKQSA
ncbi:MAG TPA: dihydrofolate reductase family protein [Candidatus Sulfotelmatobacter sp.]|nr:dihydrofolate reductase family protein [Candidatus Sulfotelmatobacter sp.]